MALEKKHYKIIEIVSLSTAVIMVVLLMFISSGWKLHFDFYFIWAVVPYFVFFLFSSFINYHKPTPGTHKISCVIAILIFMFSLFVYIDGMFIHTSSTSALLFLFVPGYIIIGGPLLLTMFAAIAKLIYRIKMKGT